MTQEQINSLRQDITNVTRQIQILSGPEFADTVPEIGTAKMALEQYKAEAERQVAAYDAANRPAQTTAAPTMGGVAPGQVNLSALTAAIQSNPALQSILGALLQNAAAPAPVAR
jgi:hypothetical protein